jgi:hypothetical protein
MYCPKCLNDTLKLRSSGVIKIAFNGKHRDASLFTFNFAKESLFKMEDNLKIKIEDFLMWYATFKNKQVLNIFEIYSNDFSCTNKCPIDIHAKISVVGPIYTIEFVTKTIQELCAKYGIECNVSEKSFI